MPSLVAIRSGMCWTLVESWVILDPIVVGVNLQPVRSAHSIVIHKRGSPSFSGMFGIENMGKNTTGLVIFMIDFVYRLRNLTRNDIFVVEMKTLIKALFSKRKKNARRMNRAFVGAIETSQFAKMGRLGQTLVVMSR